MLESFPRFFGLKRSHAYSFSVSYLFASVLFHSRRCMNSLSENFEFIYTMLFNYYTLCFGSKERTVGDRVRSFEGCFEQKPLRKLMPYFMLECARETYAYSAIRISATDETLMQQWTRTRGKTSLKIQLLMKVFSVSWHTKIHTHAHMHCVTTFCVDFGAAF